MSFFCTAISQYKPAKKLQRHAKTFTPLGEEKTVTPVVRAIQQFIIKPHTLHHPVWNLRVWNQPTIDHHQQANLGFQNNLP